MFFKLICICVCCLVNIGFTLMMSFSLSPTNFTIHAEMWHFRNCQQSQSKIHGNTFIIICYPEAVQSSTMSQDNECRILKTHFQTHHKLSACPEHNINYQLVPSTTPDPIKITWLQCSEPYIPFYHYLSGTDYSHMLSSLWIYSAPLTSTLLSWHMLRILVNMNTTKYLSHDWEQILYTRLLLKCACCLP